MLHYAYDVHVTHVKMITSSLKLTIVGFESFFKPLQENHLHCFHNIK